MKVLTYFKNSKEIKILTDKIIKKSHKLHFLIPDKSKMKLTFLQSHEKSLTEIFVIGSRLKLFAQASAKNFPESINKALKKIEKQLLKRKETSKEHIHHSS